jgi:hypothetical protein
MEAIPVCALHFEARRVDELARGRNFNTYRNAVKKGEYCLLVGATRLRIIGRLIVP